MAQRMTPKFGAGAASGLVARELPEAAAAAYGGTGTGTDRLVLLTKPHRAGAGHYVYMHVAVVPLQDLPEHLRRQVTAGAREQGAGAAAAGTNADAPAPLHRQLQLHPVVLNGEPTIELAGEGASGGVHEYSQRRALRLMAEEGGKAVWLDASGLQELIDVTGGASATETGAFYDTGLAAPENADDGDMDMPARENGVPIVALLLQLSDPGAFSYPKSPSDDAAPFSTETLLGDGRAAELGSHWHYYDVPMQVSIDAAAGAKAGDLIAGVGVKGAAGAEAAERGHGGGLSALVGVVAASSAATALAAGAAGQVAAFGLFVILVGGLSLAMAGVVAGV
ncbi:hypothetical protein U9M48_040610 [Paspalum notatum var. saurae]|uniref:Uncharacterized protein n=1 Tax=Paspalum notatum var. saurae TaxID=547442 RepID=A0AAQ3UNT3_PASNO